MPFFMGIDTSTTGTKVLIIDETGKVRGTASSPHSLPTPKPLWSEQDPEEWWIAARNAIPAALRQAGIGEIHQVRASGGGTRSLLWRQILASTLQAELVTVNSSESAAYGAAQLAGVGVRVWKDVPEACGAVIKITSSTTPNPRQAEIYARTYPLYRKLYPALKTSFAKLAD